MPHLLGYFTVMNRRQYIGLSELATESEMIMVAGHELGHSFMDYKTAASGIRFEDTQFYSVTNSRCERNANLFDAELLLPDDDILEMIFYEEYEAVTRYIEENINRYKSERAKFDFQQDQLQEFFNYHTMPSMEQIASELGVDRHLLEFKFQALQSKGFDLPNIPETKNDFLKRK